jgi:hypothetical protein
MVLPTMDTGSRTCESHLGSVIPTNRRSYEVNSNYGTGQDLRNLADALHARGMYLMVDVVANHMVSHLCPLHFRI